MDVKEDPILLRRAEIRRAKREVNKPVYSFTAEQLKAHDESVIKREEKRINERNKKYIDEEFEKRRKEFETGDYWDRMMAYLQYTLAIPIKVLVENWGEYFKPMYGDRYDKLTRTHKFMECVCAYFEELGTDDKRDIRTEAAKILDEIGVGWRLMLGYEKEGDKNVTGTQEEIPEKLPGSEEGSNEGTA